MNTDVLVAIGDLPPSGGGPGAGPTRHWTGARLHLAGAAKKPTSICDVWAGLAWSAKALLLLGLAHALTATAFAATQLVIGWQDVLLQDTLLILCSALLTLLLLLDAFARQNAYQLAACLAAGLLNTSQLIVYLATLHGHGSAAVVAICLALQAAAAAVARPAYLGFGWRMYSRIASNWRLKPEEQQRQRAAALARQRFSALAKLDGLLLVLLLVVAAVNGANPGGSDQQQQQQQPIGLLLGAAGAAAPLLAGWLAACWVAALRRRRRQLAAALDLLYPLCYLPPLLVIFAGAAKGSQLTQPHGQAYLILYPLLFLAARTATWWASRQLSSAMLAPQQAQQQLEADLAAERQQQQQLLPAELLPLVRGAWALKLPSRSSRGGSGSSGGGGGAHSNSAAPAAGCALQQAGSGISSTGSTSAPGGTSGTSCGIGGCIRNWCRRLTSGGKRHGDARSAGRQRFFQLSQDGACLRWDWRKWVLAPHIQAIHCCDESLTISLALLLEPDLRLRFANRRQYQQWQQGLLLLLALLAQPEELLLLDRRSAAAATAAAAAGGLSRSSGCSTASGLSSGRCCAGGGGGGSSSSMVGGGSRRSSSMAGEVILQMLPAAAGESVAVAAAAAVSGSSMAGYRPDGGVVAGMPAGGAGGSTLAAASGQLLVRKLTCNTSRLCAAPGSQQQLQMASSCSQTLLAAAVQRQQAADSKQQQQLGAVPARPGTIQLTATSQIVDLKIKTSSSDGALELNHPPSRQQRWQPARRRQQQQQLHTPAGGQAGGGSGSSSAVDRLRSGLRRAITLPSNLLWRASSSAAAVAAAGICGGSSCSGAPVTAAAAAGMRGSSSRSSSSPSRQRLTDPMRPTSSVDDLQAAAAAAAACGPEEEQQQQQDQQQQGQQQEQQDAPYHERRLTLGEWAELPPAPPGLGSQEEWQQQQQQLEQQRQQHTHAQRHLSPAAAAAAACSAEQYPMVQSAPRRSSMLGSGGGSGTGGGAGNGGGTSSNRLLLRGPFIHLVAFAGAVPSRLGHPGLQGAASSGGAHFGLTTATTGTSIAGSEASTPAHPSAVGSPLRGGGGSSSPERQQQLHSFQRYLQQQLVLQQGGRPGPAGGDGSSSSGGGSGGPSGAGSPHGSSPHRQESNASQLSYNNNPGSPYAPAAAAAVRDSKGSERYRLGQGSPTEAAAAAAAAAAVVTVLPPVYPGGAAAATAAAAAAATSGHRLSLASSGGGGGGSSSVVQQQQQHFAARLHGASSLGPYHLQQQQQQQPVWFDAGASSDAGSAPVSGQPSWAAAGGYTAPLARAESTFSSWGLPTPTTATAANRTPFNGLSRFNSLAHSVQHTPSAAAAAAFRQHPHFAFTFNQQQHHQQQGGGGASATPAVVGGLGGLPGCSGGHRYAGGSGGGGPSSTAAAGGPAAAGGNAGGDGGGGNPRDRGSEGGRSGAGEYDGGMTPTASSAPSPMPVVGGLGINVPVEMVDFQDLVFGKFLGEGAEGSVYAAWYQETPVAVKKTRSLMEIEMNLHTGAHDNLVGLRGLCSHGNDLYLVMELCPRGTLDVLIHKGQGSSSSSSHRLDPMKLLPIVRSIARGMLHLHTRRPAVFHRDLKPGNLFIGHGGVVKVGDFGMSRYAAQWRGQEADGSLERTLTPGVIGTAAYSAPELLNAETPDASCDRQPTAEEEARILKADVYSFGVTLYEIMERRRPFAGMDGFQIQTQWYLEPQSMRLPRPSLPDNCAQPGRQIMETLAGLVESCTQWDPDARPSFQEILTALRGAAVVPAEGSAPPTPAASLVAPF